MNIHTTIDTRATEKALAGVLKQHRFATINAMNRTGEDCNAAIRHRMEQEFTVRDKRLPYFVAPQRLRPEQRANKNTLSVVLETEGSGRILNPFETGIPRVQRSALEPVAIPTQSLRFSDRTVVPRRWYPHNLGLTPRKDASGSTFFALGRNAIRDQLTPFKNTARGATQIKGKRRTFVLDPQHHRGISPKQHGVYVRIGKGPEDIRMIWRYVREVPRPPILSFRKTAIDTWNARWPVNFAGAFAHALRTAR